MKLSLDISAPFDSLFKYKFEKDDRELVSFFDLPALGRVGLTGIDLNFWLQSFVLLSLQSVINVVVAIVIYFGIVRNPVPQQRYLIGYGFVCPALLVLPFYIVHTLDLRNMAFILCVAGATPALLIFRCIEAMHKTMPPFAGESMKSFLLYYSTSLQLKFDPKTNKPKTFATSELVSRVLSFIYIFVQTTLLYAFLMPHDYRLFYVPRNSVGDFFRWQNILNNFLMAWLTGSTLEAGSIGLGLMFSLMTGYSVIEMNDSPLTRSTSVSEFWGRRWDLIVASGLRRGIYDPLRKVGHSRAIAALLTFIVSGLLHEYMLLMMASRGGHPNNPSGEKFTPNFGPQLLFFLWNGALLLAEYATQNHPLVQSLSAQLPSAVRTGLVLLLVLPISHWFTDQYIDSCFYSDIALGFPRLTIVDN